MNSIYGMCCQKSIKPEILEDYYSGDYSVQEMNGPEEYQKYLDNNNTILSYAWGVYITAYSMEALYSLAECIKPGGVWLYSDTDSVYALGWDEDKVQRYNDEQIKRLKDAGYGPVIHNGREYYTGIAELDGVYKEFIGLHSKCYAVRKMDGSIKITVAGVPKRGALCLNNDLNNFKDDFIFPGSVTGKLTHYYLYRPEPYIDENGTEYGNSVDLHACDYKISMPKITDLLQMIENEDVTLQIYGDDT